MAFLARSLLLLPLGFLATAMLLDALLRAVFIVLSWSAPPRRERPELSSLRLAVVVPAQNEAQVIGGTVARLRAEAGAEDLFVIADNCEDETAAVAQQAGAQVWERPASTEVGKGAALRWFLAAAADELEAFEALAIFDADAVVHQGFLERAVAALARGADAVQGFIQPLTGGGTAADLAAYSEILSQRIDDVGRARLGWPVRLRGTGMVLRRQVLEAVILRLQTRVEDLEMSLLLVAGGAVVCSAPDAVVGDPKPPTARGVATQRGRWLQGQAEVWRCYGRDILHLALTGGPGAWALLNALLFRPKALVFSLKGVLLGLCLAIPFPWSWLRSGLVSVLGGAVLIDVAYYLIGLAFVDDAWVHAKALFRAPLYVIVWLRGVLIAITSQEPWLRARE